MNAMSASLVKAGASATPARESLHLLLDGFVKVARRTNPGTGRDKTDERIIAYRQGGDYFAGGLDLLGDGRAVTVTAITRTRVAEVPHSVLMNIFTRYPKLANASICAYSNIVTPLQLPKLAFSIPLRLHMN